MLQHSVNKDLGEKTYVAKYRGQEWVKILQRRLLVLGNTLVFCSQGSVLVLVSDGCYHPDDNDSFHFLFVWRKISFYASQAVYGSFYLFTHSYGTQGMITAIQTAEC